MTTLIVFGASGDLMKKKIAPALQGLQARGALPEDFRLVGFGRRPWSDADFQREITGAIGGEYVQGQFLEPSDYDKLRPFLSGQTIFYLAVPPLLYPTILERLAQLDLPRGDRTRILIEKPFGNDAATAEALDKRLGELFDEAQIYRVDHYLAKLGLPAFLRSVSAKQVERIEIRFNETIGVEGRGAFYDATGALRDWHSHHLQALAYLTMEPSGSDATAVRSARAEVLTHLPTLAVEDVGERTRRAQYEGYRNIEGVDPGSQTETFFRLKASLDLPRWEGVAILLEAGKKMAESRKEVVIRWRDGKTTVYPLESPAVGVPEYETVLLDAMAGDQRRFVSTAEIAAMWRFVDPIVGAWAEGAAPLEFYPPGTTL